MLTKEEKETIVKEHGENAQDTGKTEVQVAILSADIAKLTEHLKDNPKDHSTKRGLLKAVGKRKKLLAYIANNDIERYRALIKKLNLRK